MLDKALEVFLTQGGLLGAVAVILIIAVVWIYRSAQADRKAYLEERDEWDAARQSINEKRLDDIRAVISALEKNATVLSQHSVSLDARTAAQNQLVQTVAAMAQSQEASRERFKDQADRLERRLEGVERIQAEISSTLKAQADVVKALSESIRSLHDLVGRTIHQRGGP